MEHVIKKELDEFRAGKSCLSNLLGFMGDASERVDRGWKADMVFLDFKKAFDTVPLASLMVKLVAHGVERKLQRWIGE